MAAGVRVEIVREAEVPDTRLIGIRVDEILHRLGNRADAIGWNLIIREGSPCQGINDRDFAEKS